MPIQAESALGGLGFSWNPTTWFSSDKTAPSAQEKPIFDEMQKLGITKMTCVVRKFNALIYHWQAIKAKALAQGKTDVVAAADKKISFCKDATEYLYNAMEAYFGADATTGAGSINVDSAACKDLGAVQVVVVVAAILAAGGIAGALIWAAADLGKYALAVGYCAVGSDKAKCEAALKASQPPPDESFLTKLGKGMIPWDKVAIGAAVLGVGFVGWRYLQARMLGQSIAAGVRAGGGVHGLSRRWSGYSRR